MIQEREKGREVMIEERERYNDCRKIESKKLELMKKNLRGRERETERERKRERGRSPTESRKE